MRDPAGIPTIGVSLLAVLLLASGACSMLPGGGSAKPGEECTVRVENHVAWGLQVTVYAPGSTPPVPFQRQVRYLERDAVHHLEVPCGYASARVAGRVSRVSGLSGMQRTRFRSGVCLTPGDTVVARLDEYGDWAERWWERCPLPAEEADSTEEGGVAPDTATALR